MYKSHQRRSTSRPRLFAVVKPVVSMLAILVLSSVAAANDDDEDWVKDSLSGDHENQQFVAGERVEVTNANVADDIFAQNLQA